VEESVLGVAAVVDDVVVGFEDAVRRQVSPHELPDVLLRVEFGARAGNGMSEVLLGTLIPLARG
jgi:hypothetical protein